MKKIPLIINPFAGKGEGGRLAPAIADELRKLGCEPQPVLTSAPGEATVIARRLAQTEPCLALAGGDGTVFEVVNGMMQAGTDTTLGIIPIGTGNDFHKLFNPDPDWRVACADIVRGETRLVDVGCCNDFYFANGIGIGFDAQVAANANRIQWLHGTAVYVVALIKTLLFEHSHPHIRIQYEGCEINQKVTLTAVANGQVYGGAFRIAPDARLDDGMLEVVVADALSRLGIMKLAPRVIAGTHTTHPAIRVIRASRLQILSDVAMPVHVDGEIISGLTRLNISILPSRLRVISHITSIK